LHPICGTGTAEKDERPRPSTDRRSDMLKFLGSAVGVIFLIGLIVVVLLLMLIF
jgi:hypothetical protein